MLCFLQGITSGNGAGTRNSVAETPAALMELVLRRALLSSALYPRPCVDQIGDHIRLELAGRNVTWDDIANFKPPHWTGSKDCGSVTETKPSAGTAGKSTF